MLLNYSCSNQHMDFLRRILFVRVSFAESYLEFQPFKKLPKDNYARLLSMIRMNNKATELHQTILDHKWPELIGIKNLYIKLNLVRYLGVFFDLLPKFTSNL